MKLYRCPRCGSERLAAMSKGKPKCRCESGVKMQEVGVRSRNVSRLKVTNTGPQGGSAGAKERCVECNRLLGLRNRRINQSPTLSDYVLLVVQVLQRVTTVTGLLPQERLAKNT